MKSFNFEIYTKNPKTGEEGWDIRFINVFADDKVQAKDRLKNSPNFDCIILFNHEIEMDERDKLTFEQGYLWRYLNDSFEQKQQRQTPSIYKAKR